MHTTQTMKIAEVPDGPSCSTLSNRKRRWSKGLKTFFRGRRWSLGKLSESDGQTMPGTELNTETAVALKVVFPRPRFIRTDVFKKNCQIPLSLLFYELILGYWDFREGEHNLPFLIWFPLVLFEILNSKTQLQSS